ncbi:unnamed protein product [Auanema sp. JU1783]|nr:unnamed protein product [Auanema sp. JU1783]
MDFNVKSLYENRSVFVTGGTGFLGKVVVEKLLWSVPGIENIYLLIRPAKGMTPAQRLDKVLRDPLFTRLKERDASVFQKIIPISGDMTHENLGICQEEEERMIEKVNVCIHSAATVRFDEPLKDAVEMNVTGTSRVIELCKKMKNLISVVHVSTAYANCDLKETQEKVYEPPVPPKPIIDAVNWLGTDILDMITPKLLGKRPNTYTLTKALAEKYLQEEARDMPLIIIRPSIVGAAWKDPIPGWTDNINGATGVFAAVGKGVLTNMCGSVDAIADIVPVDVVANMIIVAASYRAFTETNEIPIMHCTTGDLNPVKWQKIVYYLEEFYNEYPSEQCIGVPSTQMHKNRSVFEFNFYYKHYLPALVLDFMNSLIGRKKRYARLYGKVWKMVETLHFFTLNGWLFRTEGLTELLGEMSIEDQQEFDFDVRTINWNSYLYSYAMGIKKFILKDNNLPLARTHLYRLKAFKTMVQALVLFILAKVLPWNGRQKLMAWGVGLILTYLYSNSVFRQYLKQK